MRNCLYFTGILTLLIGLQLFSPRLVHPQGELSLTNNAPLNPSFVSENGNGSQILTQITQESSDFEAPNNAGPDNTRGSGTR